MKAIKSHNKRQAKQLMRSMMSIMLFSMLLFLFSAANTVFAGETNNPDNLNTTESSFLTQGELDGSIMLSVDNNTLFSFSIPNGVYVRFSIFDTKGKEISILIDDNKRAGEFSTELKGANLTKGTYYYRLVVGKYREVRKLNIIK